MAVTRFVANITVSRISRSPIGGGKWKLENGATAPNVRSKITVRANATRVCARVGGKFKSETEVLSDITDTTILAHGTLLVQTVMKPQLVFKKIDLAQTPPLMSALDQKQTLHHLRPMSALPPKADMVQHRCDVR